MLLPFNDETLSYSDNSLYMLCVHVRNHCLSILEVFILCTCFLRFFFIMFNHQSYKTWKFETKSNLRNLHQTRTLINMENRKPKHFYFTQAYQLLYITFLHVWFFFLTWSLLQICTICPINIWTILSMTSCLFKLFYLYLKLCINGEFLMKSPLFFWLYASVIDCGFMLCKSIEESPFWYSELLPFFL